MTKINKLILGIFLLFSCCKSFAGIIAVDFTTGPVSQRSTGSSWVFGYQFIANKNLYVTDLGYFDSFKDGLTEQHAVGVFDSTGNLLTSTFVTPSSTLEGWFRWTKIDALFLNSGNQYTVMGIAGTEFYGADTPVSSLVINPLISFSASIYNASGTLNSSGSIWGSTIFGGNIKVIDADTKPNPVPTPSTIIMLISCLTLMVVRRRKGY